MVWGAFSIFGPIALVPISGRMNSTDYQKVLQENLLPFLHSRSAHFIFQQDGASIHTSNNEKTGTLPWLQRNNVETMPWPARSCDLNPIENLWGIVSREIYGGGKQYNTVQELKSEILRSWSNISLQTCANLVNSMPNRLKDVLESQGKHIDK
jgi:transposase